MGAAETLFGGTAETQKIQEAREPFAAYVCDDTTQAAALALARKRGWPRGEVQQGGLAAALRQFGVVAPPELMLVDLSDGDNNDQALGGLAELAAGGRVIALGNENDVRMFRAALDAGAADYLVKPVNVDTLDAAVTRAEQRGPAAGAAAAPKGRCIACVGVRGGVGASTVSGNLAALLAGERARRVCLVDLDLRFGTAALDFDLTPSAGLREALEDPDRVDDFFVDRAVVKRDEGFSVLAAEEPLEDAPKVAPAALPHVLGPLRERYDLVVLDLPRTLLVDQPAVLESLTDVVLVTDLTLPGLRDSNRLLRFLQSHANKAQVRVIPNRVGKGGPGQIEPRAFGRELETSLGRSLSLDAEALNKAALAGKPLHAAAARSRFLRDLRGLLDDMVGRPKRRGLFAPRAAKRPDVKG